MKRYYLLISLLLVCVFHSCKQTPKAQSLKLISTDEMIELMDIEEIQLVDVRTPSEYNEGHVPDAQNINFYDENFDQQIETLDKSKPIIVYCKSGGRSAKCASKLVEKGFEKIYDLEGGFSQWKFKGLTIEY
jgi:rhodanese-related sulfurtransferase